MPDQELTKTDVVTVRRKTERGDYRRASVNAILDEAVVAHVGSTVDGQAFVIPMVYGREADRLILHGSVASRLLRALESGGQLCVTVTLIDALVFSRSQFHTSVNYRSVVVVGRARRVPEGEGKRQAMKTLVEHVIPGRTAEARPPTDAELRQITVGGSADRDGVREDPRRRADRAARGPRAAGMGRCAPPGSAAAKSGPRGGPGRGGPGARVAQPIHPT